ncbi:MAG: glycosyltransferase [Candidatus Magasanikbacteria bacterium]|nr:glycosyltransferase [Candidatus Magasanikbacteria bacterium]
MKIILSGGGTLGPVIPLLAIAGAITTKYPEAQFIWVGTRAGPERGIVEKAEMPFFVIGAGKWRRYPSLLNIIDLVKIVVAFFQSGVILLKQKPVLLISAGGFISVPLHWAGWLVRIPAWVHQQDVKVGLANRLMLPLAAKVTCALEETAVKLAKFKTEWIGNPCRSLAATNEEGHALRMRWKIPVAAPVILVTGGGTGSGSINRLIVEALPLLPPEWHVIHLTGPSRPRQIPAPAAGVYPNYHVAEFFSSEMPAAYRLACLVVSRAGFGTLTELAALAKPAIIIPLPGTHQEDNAHYLARRQAVEIMEEKAGSGPKLAQLIKELISDSPRAASLGIKLSAILPRAAAEKMIAVVEDLTKINRPR